MPGRLQGLTGNGTYLLQNFKDVNDPAAQSDPIIQLYQKTMTEQGLDYHVTTYATGWIFAWFMVDMLKNAATYEGGLDRGNLMLAARNVHETNPFLINGLTSITDGTLKSIASTSSRPASIFEKSRMSLMMVSSASPDSRMVLT